MGKMSFRRCLSGGNVVQGSPVRVHAQDVLRCDKAAWRSRQQRTSPDRDDFARVGVHDGAGKCDRALPVLRARRRRVTPPRIGLVRAAEAEGGNAEDQHDLSAE